MKSELITKEYYVQFRDLFIPATWTPDVVWVWSPAKIRDRDIDAEILADDKLC